MIKIDNFYFYNHNHWIKNREKTFFTSIDLVNKYQKNRLKFILNFYNIDDKIKHHTNISTIKKNINHTIMFTSGTTSVSGNRSYAYSEPQRKLIEDHHIWKIQKCHNLTNPGNVVWFSILPRGISKNNLFKLLGPIKYASVGEENATYDLFFDENFAKKDWIKSLELLKNIEIKFVRCSPSIIEAIYYFLGDSFKFNCCLISSEETLSKTVRQMAESMFSKVIDKMVCWDGCLGWFECPHKIKHIYDEFCVVKQLENNILSVTDLNNLACPFINYLNGDKGIIDQIKCDCGISGNYLKLFEGKTIEAIYVNEDGAEKYIPGRLISERLSGFFRLGKAYKDELSIDFYENFTYRIKQTNNLEINFYYDSDIEFNEQKKEKIILFLNKIIWNDKNCKKINIIKTPIGELISKKNPRSKSLSIQSDFIKNK